MLLFGTAGIPLSSPEKTTQGGIRRLRELGLDCMEIQFVRGVKLGERAAFQVREVAQKMKVRLSAHAPYFINLNSHENEKLLASRQMLYQAAKIAYLCGAEGVVFHPAYYLGDPPENVYERVRGVLEDISSRLRREGIKIKLRPEVMGKGSQFGTIEEVIKLSREVEGVEPCLDFAHWHARTGKYNRYEDFCSILDEVRDKLGESAIKNIHIHLSGIAYGRGGESKHLILKESDFDYQGVLRALKERGACGQLICESPNLEEDALLLQKTYHLL